MPAKVQTCEPLTRSFDLARDSVNSDTRTVDLTFSTDTADVERWFGVEILDHNPKSVRLGRMRNKAPLLLDHDPSRQIGVIETAAIDGGQGKATVRFSQSALGEEIFRDIQDGIRSKVSVGYRVHEMVLENSADGKDTYRINDWEPFEVSIVSIPADDSAGVRSNPFGNRAASLSTQIRIMDPEKTELDNPEVIAPAVSEAVVTTEAPAEDGRASTVTLSHADIEKVTAQRVAHEVNRREDIKAIAREFKLPEKVAEEAIRGEVTVEKFKEATLDKLRTMNTPFSQVKAEDKPGSAPGSRAYTLETWADSAKRALGERGKSLQIPDYSRQPEIQRNYLDNGGTSFHRTMTGSVTLVDVAKLDQGIGAPVIDETVIHAPELAVFPVDIISGSAVSLSVMTGTPTVGYRYANEGRTPKKATFETKLFETQVIEEPIQVDIQGVLNASRDPGRVLLQQAIGTTKAVLSHMATQLWYGGTAQSGSDTKAAPGIIAQSSTASTHVVDSTGTTVKSSCWMLELGVGSLDTIYGNDTTLNFGSDWMEETVEDASGGKLRALVNFISGRFAPRLANKNSAIRIKNLSTESTKGLTDLLLYSAYQKASDIGLTPNAIFMNSRSLEQLRASRTATSITGQPAPLPLDWNGIPIYVSRNISNAETV